MNAPKLSFASMLIKINEMIIRDKQIKTDIDEGFICLIPLKIKTPPAKAVNVISMPRITVLISSPIVKGVNTPDRSAAAAIM